MYSQYSQYPTYPNNGYYANNGYAPVVKNVPKTSSWISAEEAELLRKSNPDFNLKVSPEDVLRGQCNHYDATTGLTTAIKIKDLPDNQGTLCRCLQCGEEFTLAEYTADEVAAATKLILDICNTIKTAYFDLPSESARPFFQILPFIKKIPQLYEIAMNQMAKYETINGYNNTNSPYDRFALYNQMTNPMANGYCYGAPGYPQQQPMGYYQQPVAQQAPAYQQPVAAPQGYNPLYGQAVPTAGAPVAAPVAQQQIPVQQQPVAAPNVNYNFGPLVQPQAAPAPTYAFNTAGAYQQQPMVNTNMPIQPQTPATAEEPVKVDTNFKK